MRPKGTRHWTNQTSEDQSIALLSTYGGSSGQLYSIDISWVSQAAGDRINIKESATGAIVYEYIMMTAAGSFSAHLPSVGLYFETGLYFNPNVSSGTANNLKVNIGWDINN